MNEINIRIVIITLRTAKLEFYFQQEIKSQLLNNNQGLWFYPTDSLMFSKGSIFKVSTKNQGLTFLKQTQLFL